jgi:hypothetical protein
MASKVKERRKRQEEEGSQRWKKGWKWGSFFPETFSYLADSFETNHKRKLNLLDD